MFFKYLRIPGEGDLEPFSRRENVVVLLLLVKSPLYVALSVTTEAALGVFANYT